MQRTLIFLCIVLLTNLSHSQGNTSDSVFIRTLFDKSLTRGKAYEDLRSLCKDIGARLSGSGEAAMAVEWSKQKMESYGFDRVYLQEVMVPHWERGTKEAGWFKGKNQQLYYTQYSKTVCLGKYRTPMIFHTEILENYHESKFFWRLKNRY